MAQSARLPSETLPLGPYMPKKPTSELIEHATAEGRSAYLDGKKDNAPESLGDGLRKAWYEGYFAARTEDRIGPILRKYARP